MSERILVVEDEAGIRLALRGLLGRLGYTVETTASALEALERIHAHPFDLVLTDLSLGPDGTGMAVLERVRQVVPEVPVVMITAYGTEESAAVALEKGAVDYVPKPFDNDELRIVVTRALLRARLARESSLALRADACDASPETGAETADEMAHETADGELPHAAAEALEAALPADLPAGLSFRELKRRFVRRFERGFLLRALRRHDGNVSRTAAHLGMVRQSLQHKIREHGLRAESWRRAAHH